MKMFIKPIVAAGLAAIMSVTSMASASALPLPVVKVQQVSDVEQVQSRPGWNERRGWDERRGWRDGRGRDRSGWYGGQRGYRDSRPGYRRHSDGWWYPLAAFGAAAIIGGAIANQPRAYSGGSHAQWCASRYRTYRAYDNTYVPRQGVRALCRSPYN